MHPNRHRRSVVPYGLPDGVGETFVQELRDLVPTLAREHGFKGEYLEREIFSKYLDPAVVSPSARQNAAVQKWIATELRNRRTNVRLQLAEADRHFGRYGVTWGRIKSRTRAIIDSILGVLDYERVLDTGVPTNGASTRVRRSPTAAIEKLTGTLHCSTSALLHWQCFVFDTLLESQKVELHEHSVLFTVPKKSDIDRVACKEPECNMLLQRSVGNYIRRRLLKVGVDLNDQTINQKLAREAVSKDLMTVDLSSASDSITRQLVFELLPFRWWSLLDDLRVKKVLINGQLHEMEMFSTMGNGFTFELESLIFYALTRAVCEALALKGRISVYGDDIIAPSAAFGLLRAVFGFAGFIMNPAKTFHTGPFRESCGRHYYGGFDVSPFYVRKMVDSLPELVNILNRLLEWDGRGWGFFITEEAYQFWERWRNHVPRAIWGGVDPDDASRLVTGDRPRKRLVHRTKAIKRDEDPAYVLWHLYCRHRDRVTDPVEVDPKVDLTSELRLASVIDCGERSSWVPDLIHRS